jgi:hypothetical protein
MRLPLFWNRAVCLVTAVLLALPIQAIAENGANPSQQQTAPATKQLTQEELAQLLAPIALYPDELIVQILMASTYPLEVVQADRWAKSHAQSAGDALAKQLEKEPWDPSVKSMVNFPTVLSAMSEKLDVTTKIGDAFLSQQKDVMDTIQMLRKKAQAAGNLKTTKEQKVVVEKETIIIQPANPQVIYVPTYSPTVVYGVWAYPSYPPYYYYPPPPPSYPAYSLAVGVAVGAAWGYAWGNANWHGNGNNGVYINNSQNLNVNKNINRANYQGGSGNNSWQHNPQHRQGVAYRDGATAKQYGQSPGRSAAARNDAARGYGDNRGGGKGSGPSAGTMDRGAGQRGGAGDGVGKGSGPSAGTMDKGAGQRGGAGVGGGKGSGPSAGTMDRGAGQRGVTGSAGAVDRTSSAGKGGNSAFGGGGFDSGKQQQAASNRGQSSRQSAGSSYGGGGSRGGGGSGGGATRGGGGGGRGGGGGGRGR